VFKDSESDMAVRIRKLGDPIGGSAESNDTEEETVGSYILTVQ
jgi:hypothetical protein